MLELIEVIKSLGYSKQEDVWYEDSDGCYKLINSYKVTRDLASLALVNVNKSINVILEHLVNQDYMKHICEDDEGLDDVKDDVDDIYFSYNEEDLNNELDQTL